MTDRNALKCQSCGRLTNILTRIVVPDGPEDGMTMSVCYECLGEDQDDVE